MTRINVKIKSEKESEINATGPDIPAEALEALYDRLDRLQEGDTLLLAGSVPATLPKDIYERILARLEGRGIRYAVDAEGALLLNVLKYKPYLIKPNRAELCGLVGRELTDDAAIEQAARQLQGRGARNVLVSLGGDGALLVDEGGAVHRALAVGGKPVNALGETKIDGDTMALRVPRKALGLGGHDFSAPG